MTDEQINAAIAKACGWEQIASNIWFHIKGAPNVRYAAPDFCTDLNAMHEADKIVTSDCNLTYANQLARITDVQYSDDPSFFCATARQRAEAYLRTLGKWEEQ